MHITLEMAWIRNLFGQCYHFLNLSFKFAINIESNSSPNIYKKKVKTLREDRMIMIESMIGRASMIKFAVR